MEYFTKNRGVFIMYGFMGKILIIDLTAKTSQEIAKTKFSTETI